MVIKLLDFVETWWYIQQQRSQGLKVISPVEMERISQKLFKRLVSSLQYKTWILQELAIYPLGNKSNVHHEDLRTSHTMVCPWQKMWDFTNIWCGGQGFKPKPCGIPKHKPIPKGDGLFGIHFWWVFGDGSLLGLPDENKHVTSWEECTIPYNLKRQGH